MSAATERPITVERVEPLPKGGWVVTWREPGASVNHATYTANPARWITGYKRGESLESLQATVPVRNGEKGE